MPMDAQMDASVFATYTTWALSVKMTNVGATPALVRQAQGRAHDFSLCQHHTASQLLLPKRAKSDLTKSVVSHLPVVQHYHRVCIRYSYSNPYH